MIAIVAAQIGGVGVALHQFEAEDVGCEGDAGVEILAADANIADIVKVGAHRLQPVVGRA